MNFSRNLRNSIVREMIRFALKIMPNSSHKPELARVLWAMQAAPLGF